MELRSGRRLHFSRRQLGQPGGGGGGGGGPDLISALPDDLLLLVLARLPCTGAAARTGVLSRRWRGLWAHLRRIVFHDIAFDSIEPALGRVSPAASLLEIHVRVSRCWSTDRVETARVNSLLRAAARLEPEELVFDLSSALIGDSPVVDLPCFHRATYIELGLFSAIRVQAGVEFSALETLYLACCIDALDSLLSSCPCLRTLYLNSTELNGDYLRVNSASLLELVVDSKWTRNVNIVAPVLKQLTISLTASSIISVLAPMVETVSWKCCYMYGSITFGLWLLELVTLQTAERQGQLPSLHIRAHCDLSVYQDEADNFKQEIDKHFVAAFSVLELHLTTEGHVFGSLVFELFGIDRICTDVRRLKVFLVGYYA